jgi:23S rRNA (pseudouridine1915-N3)-methyltransferase
VRIHLLAVGTRMPSWVNEAVAEYARRMPPHCRLELVEISAVKRGKSADTARILEEEGRRLQQAVPRGARVIALDREGRAPDTRGIADAMEDWLADGRDVCLLIGGPEGLDPEVMRRADETWSLSRLTLAHPLTRVVVAEQLYRAWSILNNLPYHRG